MSLPEFQFDAFPDELLEAQEQQSEQPAANDCLEKPLGVFPDMPNDIYHASPALSRGGISLINSSPTKFWYAQNGGGIEGRALDVGSLFHDLVMFGEEFVSKYYLKEPEVNRRKQADREELAAFHRLVGKDQVIIRDDDWDLVRYMRDSVFKNELAQELLEHESTAFEHSHFWEKDVNGYSVHCRVRPDIKNKEFGLIADLKTIATNVSWSSSVVDHHYDLQTVMYSDGVQETEDWEVKNFWFIVTEKTIKNPVTKIVQLDDWYSERGRAEYQKGLNKFATLSQSNEWFSVETTEKPRWAKD